MGGEIIGEAEPRAYVTIRLLTESLQLFWRRRDHTFASMSNGWRVKYLRRNVGSWRLRSEIQVRAAWFLQQVSKKLALGKPGRRLSGLWMEWSREQWLEWNTPSIPPSPPHLLLIPLDKDPKFLLRFSTILISNVLHLLRLKPGSVLWL